MKPAVKEKEQCAHCGDSCDPIPIIFNDRLFCCEGCKLVFQLLEENGMGAYYSLEEFPGLKQKDRGNSAYLYLSEESILEQLLDFRDDKQSHIRLSLPQIHCTACVWLLEHLGRLLPGIHCAEVNFHHQSLFLVFEHKEISLQEIVTFLAKIGYAPEILLSEKKIEKDKRINYELGLAGFCFGNIMLLSFPAYLGLKTGEFHELFSWLMLLLIVPILFYSAKSYFQQAWIALRRGQVNINVPVSLGILSLVLRSIYEIFWLHGEGYLDSLAGLVFFLLIGKWFQQHAFQKINFDRDQASFFPLAVAKIEDEEEKYVPISELETGDIIRLRHKEIVPADSELLSRAAKIDYSFVTGESDLIAKKYLEKVYAGGKNMGTLSELRILKKVSQSYLSELWERAGDEPISIRKKNELMNRVSTYFTWSIICIAVFSCMFWWGKDKELALQVLSSVLIIACPCALALTIPFTLGSAQGLLAKRQVFLRNVDTFFRLNTVLHWVFDKTGTLSESRQSLLWEGGELLLEDKKRIHALVSQSQHPVSRAIRESIGSFNLNQPNFFKEETGKGIAGIVDGKRIRIGNEELFEAKNLLDKTKGATYLEIDGELLGTWVFKSKPRPGILDMLNQLAKSLGLSLLSGDRSLESKEWEAMLPPSTHHISFGQSPFDKTDHIRSLQEEGVPVGMVGDGINDAGALIQSDCGIAVTEDASLFTPASDIIIHGSQLRKFPLFLAFARWSIWLVYAGFVLAFSYNIIGLYFAVQGLLSPLVAAILMPVSSLSLIFFSLSGTRLLDEYMFRDDKSHPFI